MMGYLSGGRGKLSVALVALGLIAFFGPHHRALAVSRDYTLDMTQSSIAVSGTVDSALGNGKMIQEQGPGSLTTTYTGTIKTDRATSSIQFLSGSSVDANVSGNWQPLADGMAGSAAADYAGKITGTVVIIVPVSVTVNFAGRDFVFGLTSGSLPVGSNQFSLSSTDITFASGDIAYRSSLGTPADHQSIIGEGSTLSGNGTLGTLSQGGRVYEKLTVPTNTSLDIVADATTTIHLTLTGQLVGTYLIPSSNGDYNQNGRVDAADYVVWRNTMGQTGVGLAADGNGDNQITSDDFTVWRSKFGELASGAGSGTLVSAVSVPEPGCLSLLLMAAVFGLQVHRRQRMAR